MKTGYVHETSLWRYVMNPLLIGVGLVVTSILACEVADTSGTASKPDAGFKFPSIGEQVVTLAEYQKVQNGMSYRQVATIIGVDGGELSRSRMDGIPGVMPSLETVMYQWANSGGSNMTAMFQNDKLMQKAQFGLR